MNGYSLALKTMRYMHEFIDRNFDRHRRDALVMERLSLSPSVVNIYSSCGSTTMTELATQGSISDYIWPLQGNSTLTPLQRLQIAIKITEGVNDLHNIDIEGYTTVAHTDISPSQFLVVNVSTIKINDFNRCRFIGRNAKTRESCPFQIGNNPGKFRSPEEYHMNANLTEMIDIYSLGNVFYSLLTESWPYESLKDDEAQSRILRGERPSLDLRENNFTSPTFMILKQAIDMCWRQEAASRPSASQLLYYLQSELNALNL